MRVSDQELLVLCKRVLEAKGIPFGIVEDGAEMVAWSEMAGLGGLKRLVKELDGLGNSCSKTTQIVFESNQTAVLDGAGSSSLLTGALAADLSYAKAKDSGLGIVEVKNSVGAV